jgi:hypothetical protein
MKWDLPTSVEIDGEEYAITNDCDYRMVLDVICALNDNELNDDQKIKTALYVFYKDISGCENIEKAIKEMYKIIAYGETEDEQSDSKPRLMDWEHDFPNIAPPVSRVLGYDVRTPNRYTHWYTFLGGYMEIGECTFQNVVSIRSKRAKGKKLENWEQEFYKENKKMVDLPHQLTEEEKEWLDSDW